MQNLYVNNDSTAVYSTHPSRPYKYGYAFTKEQCMEFSEDVAIYDIKKGDVIADVGAASGWLEGALSVLVDSVTFYIQDIDTNYANQKELDKVVSYYSKFRETLQTNSFHLIIGTMTKTNLPDGSFDKVILHNTFHELAYKKKILDDLSEKLKPGGKIIIQEGMSNNHKKVRLKGCNMKALKASEIIAYMKKNGFYLINMVGPLNSHYNVLTFEKNVARSYDLKEKIKTVEPFMTELDKLNKRSVAKDSLITDSIANFLLANMDTISNVYKTLEYYLDHLSAVWLIEKNYLAAINVLKANLKLYPHSPALYCHLGVIYMRANQPELAMVNYLKSIEIAPDHIETKNNIRQLKDSTVVLHRKTVGILLPPFHIEIFSYQSNGSDEKPLGFWMRNIKQNMSNEREALKKLRRFVIARNMSLVFSFVGPFFFTAVFENFLYGPIMVIPAFGPLVGGLLYYSWIAPKYLKKAVSVFNDKQLTKNNKLN